MTNAHDIKATMLTHALYRLHFAAAVTEYGGSGVIGIADIFGLLASGFTHEFEVKVSKSDLAGELKAIEYWKKSDQLSINQTDHRYAPVSKGGKHHIYLRGDHQVYSSMPRRPNKFSFVVPFDLQEYARKGIEGTPYGLFCIDIHENGGHPYSDVGCQKKAGYLHKEKSRDEVAANILRKACTEVEVLRGQLAAGKRCTKCHKSMPTRCDSCDLSIKKERAYRKNSDLCFKEIEKTGESFAVCMARKESETK